MSSLDFLVGAVFAFLGAGFLKFSYHLGRFHSAGLGLLLLKEAILEKEATTKERIKAFVIGGVFALLQYSVMILGVWFIAKGVRAWVL